VAGEHALEAADPHRAPRDDRLDAVLGQHLVALLVVGRLVAGGGADAAAAPLLVLLRRRRKTGHRVVDEIWEHVVIPCLRRARLAGHRHLVAPVDQQVASGAVRPSSTAVHARVTPADASTSDSTAA